MGLVRWGISISVPAIAGFMGVLAGSGLTGRRERSARRYAFLRQQLEEFYSPMLGLRQEILAKSQLRLKIGQKAEETWHELFQEKMDPEIKAKISNQRWPEFDALIKYDNKQLTEELIPAYRRMLDLFREKMWLADDTTKQYYPELVEFVEIWNRSLDHHLPLEVFRKIGHTEERLKPFYDNLNSQAVRIRARVQSGRA